MLCPRWALPGEVTNVLGQVDPISCSATSGGHTNSRDSMEHYESKPTLKSVAPPHPPQRFSLPFKQVQTTSRPHDPR